MNGIPYCKSRSAGISLWITKTGCSKRRTNNRQSFDAVKLLYSQNNFKADLLFSHYVRSKPKIFDDGFNKNTKFWGTYIVRNKLPFLKNIDFYYLGLWKRMAAFDDGIGKELRHSIGARIWNNKNQLEI